MGGLVFGFDRQRQHFNGAQMQLGHLLGVFLFGLELPQIKAVGTVDQIDAGQKQQRGLPVDFAVHPIQQPGQSSAQQIVRKSPEITFFPCFAERLVFGERDDGGNGKRVGKKVGAGCSQ